MKFPPHQEMTINTRSTTGNAYFWPGPVGGLGDGGGGLGVTNAWVSTNFAFLCLIGTAPDSSFTSLASTNFSIFSPDDREHKYIVIAPTVSD